jgi:type IV pilus assembly protein PilY1
VAGAVTIVSVSDDIPLAMFAYAADTGGNIYRISGSTANSIIGDTDPTLWTITTVASLGCGPVETTDSDSVDSCTANRKFLFGPDVIRLPNPDTGKLGILIGSGDREKPLVSYSATQGVQNYFFTLVDDPLNPDWLLQDGAVDDADGNCGPDGLSLLCPRSLTEVGLDGSVTVGAKGWRYPLGGVGREGEQVVTGALTLADVVNFSTHIAANPDSAECSSNLGTATAYNINYRNAEGEANQIPEGGLMPTPVGGMVELDDGTIVPFCIGCESNPISSSKVTGAAEWIQPIGRVYWNIQQ